MAAAVAARTTAVLVQLSSSSLALLLLAAAIQFQLCARHPPCCAKEGLVLVQEGSYPVEACILAAKLLENSNLLALPDVQLWYLRSLVLISTASFVF